MRGKPDDADDIICVIPYYGEGLGKGQAQSALETRKLYLEATFWSVRALTSRVVIAVGTQEDAAFVEELADRRLAPELRRATGNGVKSSSGLSHLPVLTLLQLTLPGPQSLPVATMGFVIRTYARDAPPNHKWSTVVLPRVADPASPGYVEPVENSWAQHLRMAGANEGRTVWERVKFVLFTEADQIIHARALRPHLVNLCDELKFVVPHRFIPMPTYKDFEFNPAAQ